MTANNLKVIFAVVACMLTNSVSSFADERNTQTDAQIDCRISLKSDTQNGYRLHFAIKNNGPKDIAFFRDFLPWYSQLLATIVVIPLNPSESPIVPISKLVNPTVNQITLTAGNILEGEIILSQWFERFDQRVAGKEVVVFWSCVLENTTSERLGRYSGFAVLEPRKR